MTLPHFVDSLASLHEAATDPALNDVLAKITDRLARAIVDGGKILFIGNGGSAAMASHVAAEFVGRFKFHRPGLAALALTTDGAALTAIGNDFGFVTVFGRQVQALAQPNDVLVALSTSGRSPNILYALEEARHIGRIGLSIEADTPMRRLCDIYYGVPAPTLGVNTAVIQEVHLVALHAICGLVEQRLFGARKPDGNHVGQ